MFFFSYVVSHLNAPSISTLVRTAVHGLHYSHWLLVLATQMVQCPVCAIELVAPSSSEPECECIIWSMPAGPACELRPVRSKATQSERAKRRKRQQPLDFGQHFLAPSSEADVASWQDSLVRSNVASWLGFLLMCKRETTKISSSRRWSELNTIIQTVVMAPP